MSIEAMKQALEALEELHRTGDTQVFDMCYAPKVIPALRQAIEQAEKQEPVAWVCEGSSSDEKHSIDYWQDEIDSVPVGTMLYTTPQPQREWVGLTDEDEIDWDGGDLKSLVKAIETKLKEKNHG